MSETIETEYIYEQRRTGKVRECPKCHYEIFELEKECQVCEVENERKTGD